MCIFSFAFVEIAEVVAHPRLAGIIGDEESRAQGLEMHEVPILLNEPEDQSEDYPGAIHRPEEVRGGEGISRFTIAG